MKLVVIEAHPRTAKLFRFTCPVCNEQGAWHPSINDAEVSAARHNRVKHPQAVSA